MDLNIKPKTVNFSEKKEEKNLHILDLAKKFLELIPKTQPIKGKINKLDFFKI